MPKVICPVCGGWTNRNRICPYHGYVPEGGEPTPEEIEENKKRKAGDKTKSKVTPIDQISDEDIRKDIDNLRRFKEAGGKMCSRCGTLCPAGTECPLHGSGWLS